MEQTPTANGVGAFKSLRDYIAWELAGKGAATARAVGLDDDSESSTAMHRALRGKMRALSQAGAKHA